MAGLTASAIDLMNMLAHLDQQSKSLGLSETGRRWEAERYVMRNDPIRAALYRIEAIAGHRAENQQCAASKLATIADLVRRVIAENDHKPFRNPLFP